MTIKKISLKYIQQTLTKRRRVKTVIGPLRASDSSSLVLPMKQVLGKASGGIPPAHLERSFKTNYVMLIN